MAKCRVSMFQHADHLRWKNQQIQHQEEQVEVGKPQNYCFAAVFNIGKVIHTLQLNFVLPAQFWVQVTDHAFQGFSFCVYWTEDLHQEAFSLYYSTWWSLFRLYLSFRKHCLVHQLLKFAPVAIQRSFLLDQNSKTKESLVKTSLWEH